MNSEFKSDNSLLTTTPFDLKHGLPIALFNYNAQQDIQVLVHIIKS
jgi:hypothetical protein